MQGNKLLILNGPESAVVAQAGDNTALSLARVRDACSSLCERLGLEVDFREVSEPAELLEWLTNDSYDALLINPTGLSATMSKASQESIETLAKSNKPVVEVHVHNIFRGGDADKPMRIRNGEMGFVCGLGIDGYRLAIKAVHRRLAGK